MPVLEHGATRNPASTELNPLLALIARFRWAFFALVALFFIFSFNGQWRVARDSAAYRGLGHQLATTGKYVFRDKQDVATYSDQQDTRYPGMPLMLAAVEKVFGRHDAPAVLSVTLMGVAAVILSYFLVKPSLPMWLTVAVVFGTGINGRFLTHCQEILADVPFLTGVVLSLLAFDRLQRARNLRSRAINATLLVIGLLLCAAMRPTFWVIAVALVATCVWGLFRPLRADEPPGDARNRRLTCGLTLALLAVVAVVFLLVVDLRGRTAMGYEGKLVDRFRDFQQKVIDPLGRNTVTVLEESLPEVFFGTQLGSGFIPVGGGQRLGFSTLGSLVVIVAGVWLVRRNVMWGMTVLATVGTMAVIGSVPRYFLMILPLLLAGWGLFVAWLADRFKDPAARAVVAAAALGLVVAPNLLGGLNLIREQRGLSHPRQGLKQVGFEKSYNSGKWAGVYAVANMVRQNVRPDQEIIGPEATVLTFLSDRHVFGLGMLLPRRDHDGIWDRKIRNMKSHFAYAVFPDKTDKLYDDKDVVTGKLIRMGLLKPTKTIATAGGYTLSEFEVVTMGRSGRPTRLRDRVAATQPKVRAGKGAAATTQPKRRRRQAATNPTTTTTTATTRPHERPRGRRSRGAATTPAATAPASAATAPAVHRSSRARRRAAAAATRAVTRPTTRPTVPPSGVLPTPPPR